MLRVMFRKIDPNQLAYIGYLLPILALVRFVAIATPDYTPHWDDWTLVPLFEKVATGKAEFIDFFAQHNEHRIFFPRLIFVFLAFITQWNLKVEMFFSIGLTLVTFWGLYKIAELSRGQNDKFFHLFNILTSILVFSITQWDWLWGFQIAWYLIHTCVVMAIFTLTVPQRIAPKARYAIAALFCTIASFSSAQGLFSWVALLPLVSGIEGQPRQKQLRVGLWILLFIIVFGIYNIDYGKSQKPRNLLLFFENPKLSLEFLLTLLGTPLGIYPIIFGGITLAIFIIANVYFFRQYGTQSSLHISPWISLGWFSLIFMLATTVGRVSFGLEFATRGHYIGGSMLLIVACLQIGRYSIGSSFFTEMRVYRDFGAYFLVALLCCLLVRANSVRSLIHPYYRTHMNASGDCVQIINYLDESFYLKKRDNFQEKGTNNCLSAIHFDPMRLKDLVKKLDNLGFREIVKNMQFSEPLSDRYGVIENIPAVPLKLQKNDAVDLEGWAIAPVGEKQPDLVLFSYGDKRLFFDNAEVLVMRPDVVQVKSPSRPQVGWQRAVSLNSLPVGKTVIKAWIYDAKSRRFIQLLGEVKIEVLPAS